MDSPDLLVPSRPEPAPDLLAPSRPVSMTARAGPGFRRRIALSGSALLLAATACAAPPPEPPAPRVDVYQAALAAELATRLDEPTRILFDWTLQDRDLRASGRGVARIEPPYRARLDLFLENGESVAQAALVDDDLRIPEWVPEGLIPPAPLLWASLGVFRPGAAARYVGGRPEGEGVAASYELGLDARLRFELVNRVVRNAEIARSGRTVETLRLQGRHGRFPQEATYRNLGAFRELTVAVDSVEAVDGFPEDIWMPALR